MRLPQTLNAEITANSKTGRQAEEREIAKDGGQGIAMIAARLATDVRPDALHRVRQSSAAERPAVGDAKPFHRLPEQHR